MLTSDKDYGQLVSDHIRMYKPGKFGQPAEILGVAEICEKYKIERPEQLIDMLGLWGDTSDNIPGVPGIGQVRAQKLLANYGSIEEMYARNFDKDNEKTRTLMNQYKEQAFLSKELATIMIDIPMEYDFDQMAYNGPDPQKLKAIFDELEFKALTKRIFTDLSLQVPQPQAAPDLFSPIEEAEPQTSMETETHKTVFELPQTVEVQSIKDISAEKNDTIFFTWLFQQERIAGFAFAFDETGHQQASRPGRKHPRERACPDIEDGGSEFAGHPFDVEVVLGFLESAGRIDQDSPLPERRPDVRQNPLLPGGTEAYVGFRPVLDGLPVLAEHPFARTWDIRQDDVETSLHRPEHLGVAACHRHSRVAPDSGIVRKDGRTGPYDFVRHEGEPLPEPFPE